MTILEYHRTSDPDMWLRQIRRSDWRAGQYLARVLEDGAFHRQYGPRSRVLLLTEGPELLAFCTFAQQDEIPAPELTPWCGFVYTFPGHRGQRLAGILLKHACQLAAGEGFPWLYLSSDEVGLYEKYGAEFWRIMALPGGEETRVYRLSSGPACSSGG